MRAADLRYDHALLGGWANADSNYRSMRHEVLAELCTAPVRWSPDGCEVERGRWIGPYMGQAHLDVGGLDVDHVVPLAYTWGCGADGWDAEGGGAFANDPADLLPVARPGSIAPRARAAPWPGCRPTRARAAGTCCASCGWRGAMGSSRPPPKRSG